MKQLLCVVVAALGALSALSAAAQTTPTPPSAPHPQSSAGARAPTAQLQFTPDFLMDFNSRSSRNLEFRPSGNPLEASEASRFAAAAGIDCKVVDAAVVTRKNVLAYEMACEKDLGWIVVRSADDQYAAYDCLALAASAKAITKGREIATCRLRANVGHQKAGLQSLVTKAHLFCTVVDGAFKGVGGAPQISRYEVKCKNGTGYLIDVPTPGSTAQLAAASCDVADTLGSACTLKR